MAGGTMAAGNPTVPWVAWSEDFAGTQQIFVSRLVGGNHFALVNAGQPISLGANDSTRPDITFAGHTPYVSWREQISGAETKAFTGHFVNPANPTFVLDTPGGVARSPAGLQADVRAPISSGCTADPFNGDGSSCQGSTLGTPFFLFTDGKPAGQVGGPQRLFAHACRPDAPITGGAAGTTVGGAVDPHGALARVHFDFGTSVAYGQATPPQLIGASNAAQPFVASLGTFPPGTTVHYRAVAQSDFGTFTGADRTFTTPNNPPPPPPPPPDRTKPRVKLRVFHTTVHKLRTKHPFKARIKVSEPATVKVALYLGTHRLARKTLHFRKATTRTVKLTVTKKGRKRLKGHKHPKLTLKTAAKDKAGNLKRSKKSERL